MTFPAASRSDSRPSTLRSCSTPYGAGLEFFWFGKPVRSEIFVVKILGTGVALEIDDGSVAKVILK